MNYFTSKIDTIRDQIVTMQPSAILSHEIVYYTVGTESIQTPLNFSLFVILQPFAKII